MRGLTLLLVACLLAACKPAPEPRSAHDVKIVSREPRCEKIGVVEGVGGNERAARADALGQASDRGATHVRLEPAHPDLEDGLTMIVTATMYRCPDPGTEFPPDGYR